MNKLNISTVIGALTLVGLLSGFILKFGPLPQAYAELKTKIDKYDEQVVEMRAEQKYIKEKTNDIYDLIKKGQKK